MKWTIQIAEGNDFIKVNLEGDYSVSEIPQTLTELFSRPDWKPGKSVLFDDTKLVLANTNLDEIKKSSQLYSEYAANYGDSKIAVLAGSLTDFARGRQFELLTGNKVKTNIRIFLKEEEAVNWLNSQQPKGQT